MHSNEVNGGSSLSLSRCHSLVRISPFCELIPLSSFLTTHTMRTCIEILVLMCWNSYKLPLSSAFFLLAENWRRRIQWFLTCMIMMPGSQYGYWNVIFPRFQAFHVCQQLFFCFELSFELFSYLWSYICDSSVHWQSNIWGSFSRQTNQTARKDLVDDW